jgi:CBS domain-containing protein
MLLKNMMEIKAKDLVTATPSTSINDAMDMLIKNNIGCLPVIGEKGELIGILSERDVLLKVHQAKEQYPSLKVGDIMTSDPIAGKLDDDISSIARTMEEKGIRHMPVIRDEHVIGLISLWEIYKTKMKNAEHENRHLSSMLHGRDKTGDYDDHY